MSSCSTTYELFHNGLVKHGVKYLKNRGQVFVKYGVKYYKLKVKYLKNGGSSIAFQESSIRKMGVKYRQQLVKYF